MTKEKLPERPVAVIGAKGWQRATFPVASLYGGHLGRTRTLARLADRFYWSGMADDVKDWLSQCVACIKRKSPVGRHHPLGNIPVTAGIE